MPTPTIIKHSPPTAKNRLSASSRQPGTARIPAVPALYVPLSGLPGRPRELIILDDSPQSHQHIIDRLPMARRKPLTSATSITRKNCRGQKTQHAQRTGARRIHPLHDDDDYYPADKISYTIAMMQKTGRSSPVPTRSPSGTAISTVLSKPQLWPT